jgi:hypothetical protein
MHYDDIEELKARIVAVLDVTDFLDLIGYDLADLVNIPEIEEQIEEAYTRIDRACR